MDFSKTRIIKESDLAKSVGVSHIDYTPLFKKLATLAQNEVLTIPIEKNHYTKNIKNAVEREFNHNKYHVFQRTIGGKLHCCIKHKK